MDRKTPTYGGYSKHYVVDENYALKVKCDRRSRGRRPAAVCRHHDYSPLKRWGVGPGKKVAIAGLGGLGHMGVKLAVAMGADVTVLSTSPSKEADARKLGAQVPEYKRRRCGSQAAGSFDLILDTISAEHDYNAYLSMLGLERRYGHRRCSDRAVRLTRSR